MSRHADWSVRQQEHTIQRAPLQQGSLVHVSTIAAPPQLWPSSLALVPSKRPIGHQGGAAHHLGQLVQYCMGTTHFIQGEHCMGTTHSGQHVDEAVLALPTACTPTLLPSCHSTHRHAAEVSMLQHSPSRGVGPMSRNTSSTPPVTRQLQMHLDSCHD